MQPTEAWLTDKFRPGVIEKVFVQVGTDGRYLINGVKFPLKMSAIRLHSSYERAIADMPSPAEVERAARPG